MIIPVRCPLCDDILLNEYKNNLMSRSGALTKTCNKRLNHKYYCNLDSKEEIYLVQIVLDFAIFYWDFTKKKTWFAPNKIPVGKFDTTTILPWFEPDIKSKKAFFNKLKTYVLFS